MKGGGKLSADKQESDCVWQEMERGGTVVLG